MCTGQRPCEHEHLLLENQKIHSKESFGSSFSSRRTWWSSAGLAAVVSVQFHHEGWVGACFLPARSLWPWACLHVGLISVPWSPFPFLHLLHSSPLSVSALTLALCRSFTLRFSMVFCAGFPLALSWLLDMSLFMSASFWFWREKVYGRDLYFLTCRALYVYCVWSLIEVFGLPFEWFSVDVKKVASCNSVSKLFCMKLCMCMWFCVWWCALHDASHHRGHFDKYTGVIETQQNTFLQITTAG